MVQPPRTSPHRVQPHCGDIVCAELKLAWKRAHCGGWEHTRDLHNKPTDRQITFFAELSHYHKIIPFISKVFVAQAAVKYSFDLCGHKLDRLEDLNNVSYLYWFN